MTATTTPPRSGAAQTPAPPLRPQTIRLQGVSVLYPAGVRALDGINLHAPQGQKLAILGASGSGKTTLLRVLARRLTPDAGQVEIEGRIATIHQDLRLVKQRSALENVLQGCLGRHGWMIGPWRFPKAERQRAEALLKRVGLEHRTRHRVSRLSGGEQQRVAIARALMQDPTILLADEPVASLDAANALAIMKLLAELADENGLTVIAVMHDTRLAESFAERVVGLHQGRIVYDSEKDKDQTFDPILCAMSDGAVPSAPLALPAPSAWRQYFITGLCLLVGAAVMGWALRVVDFDPERNAGLFGRVLGYFQRMAPGTWAEFTGLPWKVLWLSLIETIQMSIIGTSLAILVSWPLAALGARNICPAWMTAVARFILNVIRTIPSLIWALIFVSAVGLGPLAGILALMFYSIGYLTKFFYEAFEAVDQGPSDALTEIGANGPQKFLFAIWPGARPAIFSSCIFMLEYNVRAASVLGVVGAGGIGYYIKGYVDMFNHQAVFASLLLLRVVVVVLDWVSTRLRAWLVSG